MKTNAKQRERWQGIGEWRTDDYAGPVIDRLIADVDDAERLLERVRPILCGLAIEVEQKQKAEGSHYLTDAVAVKDAVVAYLSGLSTDTSPCERVSDQQYLDGVRIKPHCATHGCDWPDGEKECPA